MKCNSHLALVIDLALPHIEDLPPDRRADAYDGIALAWQCVDNKLSGLAEDTANQIRDAAHSQLLFSSLLKKAATKSDFGEMSQSSDQREVIPAGDDTVVNEAVNIAGPDDALNGQRQPLEVDPVAKQNGNQEIRVLLKKVMARHTGKHGHLRTWNLYSELLCRLEALNDDEITRDVGKMIFYHGALMLASVRPLRKRNPTFAITVPESALAEPLTKEGAE